MSDEEYSIELIKEEKEADEQQFIESCRKNGLDDSIIKEVLNSYS